MAFTFRSGFYVGLLAALVVALYLTRLWGAERQVQLHTEHLIRSLENRSWSRFNSALADSYTDQWGQDRALVSQRSRALFGYLRGIRIVPHDTDIHAAGRDGFWRAMISVEGADESELAAMVKERVNRLNSPFSMQWRQMSWKPWDWKLVRVSNEGLDLPSGFEQFP